MRQADQIACPSPTDAHLRVANLSRDGRAEFLVVNPTDGARPLYWQNIAPISLIWKNNMAGAIPHGEIMELPAKGWIIGLGDANVPAQLSSINLGRRFQGGI